jgi:CRISPR-associated protein Csd2
MHIFMARNSSEPLDRKIDIVVYTMSKYSVMNGDPDNNGNQRIDPATGQALQSPGSTKCWIRSYGIRMGDEMYIQRDGAPLAGILNEFAGTTGEGSGTGSKKKVLKADKGDVVTLLAKKYKDIRWFGAALTAPVNKQITGPIQVTFGESVDKVEPMELTITRGVVTREADAEKERTMGKLPSMTFGLFRSHIHVNPFCARTVGTTWGDLDDMLHYLIQSFDAFRSTIRSNNHFVKMVIFTHPDENGKEASWKLLDRVQYVRPSSGAPSDALPTSLNDYEFSINDTGLTAKGITVEIIDA